MGKKKKQHLRRQRSEEQFSNDKTVKSDEKLSQSNSSTMRPGLVNLGNTCFLNASLQVLAASKWLSAAIERIPSHLPVHVGLANILKQLRRGDSRNAVNPGDLLQVLGKRHPMLKGRRQHDAHELMRALFEDLEIEGNSLSKNERQELSCFHDLFAGQLSSEIVCLTCRRASTTVEPFYDLSVALAPPLNVRVDLEVIENFVKPKSINVLGSERSCDSTAVSALNQEEVDGFDLSKIDISESQIRLNISPVHNTKCFSTIDDCLSAYFRPEVLDGDNAYLCKSCSKLLKATKKYRLSKCPPLFLLHIKRFEKSCAVRSSSKRAGKQAGLHKVDDRVEFERQMVLGGVSYDVVGVVEHQGSMSGGHYVAYVCGDSPSSPWYYCSDSIVRPVKLERVLATQAYILLYERTTGPKQKCFHSERSI